MEDVSPALTNATQRTDDKETDHDDHHLFAALAVVARLRGSSRRTRHVYQLAGLLRSGGRFASTIGVTPEGVTAYSVMADPTPQTLARLAADVVSGALRVPVTGTCPLEQVTEAFAAFGAGTLGKLAITCS
ncbi:MAG: hypothetical protein ABIQ18_21455 [Umezawaea sp.]